MRGKQVTWKILAFLGLFLMHGLRVAANADGRPEGYHLVRDCQEEWLVYSKEYTNYVPYIRALHESEPSVSILLNLVQDRHFQFLLKTERDAFLFIDGALQTNIIPETWMSVSCDSLYRKYGKSEVMLTVFGLRGLDGVRSFMAFPEGSEVGDSLQVLASSLVLLKPRQADIFRDFSVIAWLMILLVGAIVFLSAPQLAYKLTNPAAFFSRDFRTELYHHHRAYSPVIIAATLALALIVAFLLLITESYITSVIPTITSVSEVI